MRDHYDINVHVFGLEDEDTAADRPAWEGLPVYAARVSGLRALGYAPDLYRAIRDARLDVLHLACLWMYPTLVSLRWMREGGGPVVVSPHGTLDTWALANSRWKKVIAAALYEKRHLARAACLHALCQAEANALRDFGLKNPICVIPNGVVLPDRTAGAAPPSWATELPCHAKALFFLGRLHPKKNVLALIEAWVEVNRQDDDAQDWWLVIGGWDQLGHAQECQDAVERTGAPRVLFAGQLHGASKDVSFRAASAFVLPSLSEGLPMSVLEAWSYGLPVLMTPECNLPVGAQFGAAVEIGSAPEAIAAGLRRLFSMTDAERTRMGNAGRALVEDRYAWTGVAGEMLAIYQWVLSADARPASCIQGYPA
jgi:poly(glycerol-phosphate) alpha-glucosyltransferase